MPATLRRRVLVSTALLLGLQGLGAVVALAAGRQLDAARDREHHLAEVRTAVLELADATREMYVHETHTFIEGGSGHLGHQAEIVATTETRLAAVRALDLPVEVAAELEAAADALHAAQHHFERLVAPAARAGTLDHETSVRLHAQTEAQAEQVAGRLANLVRHLDIRQASERVAMETTTRRTTTFMGVLAVGSLGVGILVARALVQAVTGPLTTLRSAVESMGAGEDTRAPEGGDEELAAVGRAFNRMRDRVRQMETARIARERLAALGEMSAAVAHELMNNLAVIVGHEAVRDVPAVRSEAEHMRRIVEGLLGFARPGAEAPVRLDLGAAVGAAVDRLVPFADSREVRIDRDCPPGIEVMVPPSAVRQVMDNLLRNAVEAGSPTVEVVVGATPAHVEVRDRGHGIPAQVAPRLYDPFVTGRPEGTGLGLAVCQRIVRETGGTLGHHARDGGGTVARWELGDA